MKLNLRRYFIVLLLPLILLACGTFDVVPGGPGHPLDAPALARAPSWAHADIAKPTHTPTPMPPPPAATATPTEIPPTASPAPTETSSLLIMTIVDDGSSAQTHGTFDAPASSVQTAASGKYILVSISEQHLYAYQDGQLVQSFVASTGMGNSTRIGTFSVLDKIPNAYGATWNIWMPDWLGIYESGSLENGIHALPILPGGARLWSGYLGTPISYGCVVLGVDEAHWLYDWAEVGTPVEIRW